MKRMIGLSLLVVVGVALSLGAQEKKEEPKAGAGEDLFPLKKDATWTYKVGDGELTVKVTKDKVKVGQEDGCWELETSANGKVAATEAVKVKDGGVYRLAVNGTSADTPILFLKLPAVDKDSWDVNTKVQGREVKGKFTTKKVKITVLGQETECFLVESSDLKIESMDTSIKAWYAKGVGMVKMDFKLAGQEASLELTKYEAGK